MEDLELMQNNDEVVEDNEELEQDEVIEDNEELEQDEVITYTEVVASFDDTNIINAINMNTTTNLFLLVIIFILITYRWLMNFF